MSDDTLEPSLDIDGWVVLQNWGDWYLCWNVEDANPSLGRSSLVLTHQHAGGYWIGLNRIDEPDWYDHITKKQWMTTSDCEDLAEALAFCRKLKFGDRRKA